MAGVVKPGDEGMHRVLSDGPVKALVLWVPGGESDRIAPADRHVDASRRETSPAFSVRQFLARRARMASTVSWVRNAMSFRPSSCVSESGSKLIPLIDARPAFTR